MPRFKVPFIRKNIPDVNPDAFTFTSVTGATVSTQYTSNQITVTGINVAVVISIVGGEYQVNGGSWRSTPSTVVLNDTVKVRLTTSASDSTAVIATLSIGSGSSTFTVTTAAALPDSVPDAFSFSPVTNATLSTVYTDQITVSGINTESVITAVNLQYRINGGTWTSAAGQVLDGDVVDVRITSSSQNGTAVSGTLTIGGVSASFSVTTLASVVGFTPVEITTGSGWNPTAFYNGDSTGFSSTPSESAANGNLSTYREEAVPMTTLARPMDLCDTSDGLVAWFNGGGNPRKQGGLLASRWTIWYEGASTPIVIDCSTTEMQRDDTRNIFGYPVLFKATKSGIARWYAMCELVNGYAKIITGTIWNNIPSTTNYRDRAADGVAMWVDTVGGQDSWPGTQTFPKKTFNHAHSYMTSSPGHEGGYIYIKGRNDLDIFDGVNQNIFGSNTSRVPAEVRPWPGETEMPVVGFTKIFGTYAPSGQLAKGWQFWQNAGGAYLDWRGIRFDTETLTGLSGANMVFRNCDALPINAEFHPNGVTCPYLGDLQFDRGQPGNKWRVGQQFHALNPTTGITTGNSGASFCGASGADVYRYTWLDGNWKGRIFTGFQTVVNARIDNCWDTWFAGNNSGSEKGCDYNFWNVHVVQEEDNIGRYHIPIALTIATSTLIGSVLHITFEEDDSVIHSSIPTELHVTLLDGPNRGLDTYLLDSTGSPVSGKLLDDTKKLYMPGSNSTTASRYAVGRKIRLWGTGHTDVMQAARLFNYANFPNYYRWGTLNYKASTWTGQILFPNPNLSSDIPHTFTANSSGGLTFTIAAPPVEIGSKVKIIAPANSPSLNQERTIVSGSGFTWQLNDPFRLNSNNAVTSASLVTYSYTTAADTATFIVPSVGKVSVTGNTATFNYLMNWKKGQALHYEDGSEKYAILDSNGPSFTYSLDRSPGDVTNINYSLGNAVIGGLHLNFVSEKGWFMDALGQVESAMVNWTFVHSTLISDRPSGGGLAFKNGNPGSGYRAVEFLESIVPAIGDDFGVAFPASDINVHNCHVSSSSSLDASILSMTGVEVGDPGIEVWNQTSNGGETRNYLPGPTVNAVEVVYLPWDVDGNPRTLSSPRGAQTA